MHYLYLQYKQNQKQEEIVVHSAKPKKESKIAFSIFYTKQMKTTEVIC